MLNNQQFDQLMLQYNQLKNGAEDIYKMLQAEDYNGAMTMLKAREPIYLNCKCMLKYLELTEEQQKIYNETFKELQSLEQRNLELLTNAKNAVEEDLKRIQKAEKIQHAYEIKDPSTGTIINVEE